MARVILVSLAMFLLPFAFYIAFRFFTRIDDGRASVLEGLPTLQLSLIGTALVAVALAVTATLSDKRQGTYEPAVVKDGKVLPGRIR